MSYLASLSIVLRNHYSSGYIIIGIYSNVAQFPIFKTLRLAKRRHYNAGRLYGRHDEV